jgi:hypothetical protein
MPERMTVRELIKALLDQPMSDVIYIGKGMGLVTGIKHEHPYVILSPEDTNA